MPECGIYCFCTSLNKIFQTLNQFTDWNRHLRGGGELELNENDNSGKGGLHVNRNDNSGGGEL